MNQEWSDLGGKETDEIFLRPSCRERGNARKEKVWKQKLEGQGIVLLKKDVRKVSESIDGKSMLEVPQ